MQQIEHLKKRLADVHNLHRAAAVLQWDQTTYMPPKGIAARAEQLATLEILAHQILVSDETRNLLEEAEAAVQAADLSADDDATCLTRIARRDYRQSATLPLTLVDEMSRTFPLAYDAWVKARENNDFAVFAPWLEKNFELARRQAEYLGYKKHPYDALLDLYEPGMTVERLQPMFDELRSGLAPLLRAIATRLDAVDDNILHQPFERDVQLHLAEEIVRRLGYDFSRGRIDLTAHPYATPFSRDDVRLTTRIDPSFLPSCIMGTIHEAGHGIYEQNIAPSLVGTPLAGAISLGIHESQSRLFENVVGRSRGFWQHFFPLAQHYFPAQLGNTDEETFFRALNKVSPSYIRTEADEVTYNLHVVLRFMLEKALLAGEIVVNDVPEMWDTLMQEYVGIKPSNFADGVLQDMHWSGGMIGYFPTYTLGNILSVQLYEAAVAAEPRIPQDITQGKFDYLLDWLRTNIYCHGRKYDPSELIERATGRSMSTEPYVRYLREKFGALYGVAV